LIKITLGTTQISHLSTGKGIQFKNGNRLSDRKNGIVYKAIKIGKWIVIAQNILFEFLNLEF